MLQKFAKTGQDKFASLFSLFVSERAKSIPGIPQRSFCRFGWLRQVRFEVRSWSSVPWVMPEIGDPRHPSSLKPRKSGWQSPHSSLPTLPRVYAFQSKATPHLLRRKAGFTEKQRLSRVRATFCCPKWLRNPSCTGGLLEMDLGSLP
jgi:hypothetical protein